MWDFPNFFHLTTESCDHSEKLVSGPEAADLKMPGANAIAVVYCILTHDNEVVVLVALVLERPNVRCVCVINYAKIGNVLFVSCFLTKSNTADEVRIPELGVDGGCCGLLLWATSNCLSRQLL